MNHLHLGIIEKMASAKKYNPEESMNNELAFVKYLQENPDADMSNDETMLKALDAAGIPRSNVQPEMAGVPELIGSALGMGTGMGAYFPLQGKLMGPKFHHGTGAAAQLGLGASLGAIGTGLGTIGGGLLAPYERTNAGDYYGGAVGSVLGGLGGIGALLANKKFEVAPGMLRARGNPWINRGLLAASMAAPFAGYFGGSALGSMLD